MISPKKAIWLRTSGSFHACPTRMRRSIAAASPNVGLEARPNDADPMRSDRATLQSVSEEVLRKDQEPPRHGKGNRCPGEKVFGNHLSNAQEQLGLRRLSQFCTGEVGEGINTGFAQ